MSEESKTADMGDYVMMGDGAGIPSTSNQSNNKLSSLAHILDDPNLTQEEKDHRMALALQQEENAVAYDAHKKKHEEQIKANEARTARSGTFTKLAAVRQKDHGMLRVPAEYTNDNAYHKSDSEGYVNPNGTGFAPPPINATPQEMEDWKLAQELQKVEQAGAGTVRAMEKIAAEEETEEEAKARRTGRSTFHINQKGLFKH